MDTADPLLDDPNGREDAEVDNTESLLDGSAHLGDPESEETDSRPSGGDCCGDTTVEADRAGLGIVWLSAGDA